MVKTASSLASCWHSWTRMRASNTANRNGLVVIVRPGFEPQNGIGIGIVAGEHDDRRFKSVLAQDAHGFAAVDVRQSDIHDDEVDLSGFGGLHAFAAVFGRDGFEFV